MFSLAFIIALVIGVFAVDFGKRWWQEREWRRRTKGPKRDAD